MTNGWGRTGPQWSKTAVDFCFYQDEDTGLFDVPFHVFCMTADQLKQLEDNLWQAADRLRVDSDLKASEHSTPVLGLIFLRFATIRYHRHTAEIDAEYTALLGITRLWSIMPGCKQPPCWLLWHHSSPRSRSKVFHLQSSRAKPFQRHYFPMWAIRLC